MGLIFLVKLAKKVLYHLTPSRNIYVGKVAPLIKPVRDKARR